MTPAEVPGLLGELEKIRAAAWLRMVGPGQAQPISSGAEDVLDVEQAARYDGTGKGWARRRL